MNVQHTPPSCTHVACLHMVWPQLLLMTSWDFWSSQEFPESNIQSDTPPCKSASHSPGSQPKAPQSCIFDLRKHTFSQLTRHCAWGPSEAGLVQASSLSTRTCSHCTKMKTCFAHIPVSSRRTLRSGRELCLTSHPAQGLALSRFPATISSGKMQPSPEGGGSPWGAKWREQRPPLLVIFLQGFFLLTQVTLSDMYFRSFCFLEKAEIKPGQEAGYI